MAPSTTRRKETSKEDDGGGGTSDKAKSVNAWYDFVPARWLTVGKREHVNWRSPALWMSVLLLIMSVRMHAVRHTHMDELAHVRSKVQQLEQASSMESALLIYRDRSKWTSTLHSANTSETEASASPEVVSGNATESVPGGTSVCRIFHACVMPDEQIVLPYWMERHRRLLEVECGIRDPLFHLLDKSALEQAQSPGQDLDSLNARFGLLDLNYQFKEYDLLGVKPTRISRTLFMMDMLLRLVFGELVADFHEEKQHQHQQQRQDQEQQQQQQQRGVMEWECMDDLGDATLAGRRRCASMIRCQHEESTASQSENSSSDAPEQSASLLSSYLSAAACTIQSRYRLAVFESDEIAFSDPSLWQTRFWQYMTSSWSAGTRAWYPLRKRSLYAHAGPFSAVCFRSVVTSKPRSERDVIALLEGARADDMKRAFYNTFGLAPLSKHHVLVSETVHAESVQQYCTLDVVILVRTLDRDHDENEQVLLGRMPKRDPLDDLGGEHDIPHAERLSDALDHALKLAKLWAVKFNVRIARLDLLDFEGQIALMQSADIVIGAHDPQLANIVFMRRFSTVIEIYPFGCFADSFRDVAAAMRVRHYSIISAPEPSIFVECIKDANPEDSAAALTVLRGYYQALQVFRAHGTPVDLKLDEPRMYHANRVAYCAHRQRLAFDFGAVARTAIQEAARVCKIKL